MTAGVQLGGAVVHPDDAAEAPPLLEQVEGAVYVVEAHLVRDELVQLQLLMMQSRENQDGSE